MTLRRLARVCICALSVSAALAAAAPAAAQTAQLTDLASWTTFANGDEVVSAAVHPSDGTLWVGTEGGGLVIWDAGRRTFEQHVFPGQAGLLSNLIYDIAFDPRTGDAWLATDFGVTHVERATMVFRTTVADTETARPVHSSDVVEAVPIEQFPDSRIFNAVAVADDGTVWVGSPDRGVAVRGTDGAWRRFIVDDDEPERGPQRSQVADIATLPNGLVWVAHGRTNYGPVVSVYDPSNDTWSGIPAAGPGDAGGGAPRTSQVMALAVERSGGGAFAVWCATWNRGVYRYDVASDRWTEYNERDTRVADDPTSGLCDDTVWAIAEREGRVWAACAESSGDQGRGVSHWDAATDRWHTLRTTAGLPTNIVTAIALGEGGAAYLGTDEPKNLTRGSVGVVPVRLADGELTIGEALRTAGPRPFVNEITALAFDGLGRLWAGTRQAGVMRFDPQTASWTQFTRDSTGGRLTGDAVTDLAVVDDEVWVASTHERFEGGAWIDGGVGIYSLGANDWTAPITAAGAGLASSQVGSVAADGSGHAWLGHGLRNSVSGGSVTSDVQLGQGLDVVDRGSRQVVAQYNVAESASGLAGDTVLDLSIQGGEVWAATSYAQDGSGDRAGGGVSRWDGREWTAWRSGDGGLVSYADAGITGDVRAIFADPNGYVWAGSYAGAEADILNMWPLVDAVVNRYDPQAQAWTAAQFAREGWVSSIARDALNQVWVGTTRGHMQELWRGDGVLGEDTENPKIRDLADFGLHVGDIALQGAWVDLGPHNSGLAARAVTALAIEPATGFVWVGTEGGGLSVYTRGEAMGPPPTPPPSPTPCPTGVDCPTVTPTATRTVPPTAVPPTLAPTAGPGTAAATAMSLGDNDPDEMEPPPEVPEAGTWLLLLTGLGVIGGYAWWRQRQAAVAG